MAPLTETEVIEWRNKLSSLHSRHSSLPRLPLDQRHLTLVQDSSAFWKSLVALSEEQKEQIFQDKKSLDTLERLSQAIGTLGLAARVSLAMTDSSQSSR